MIKIVKATSKESLDKEWNKLNLDHYGQEIKWIEKKFKYKALDEGKVVGLIEGKLESGVLFISALITAKNSRGQGIGTMLIKRAEAFGKKYGAHKTWLVTGKHWSENTFYKKLGFKIIGELPDFYFHTDFVIYSRPLK